MLRIVLSLVHVLLIVLQDLKIVEYSLVIIFKLIRDLFEGDGISKVAVICWFVEIDAFKSCPEYFIKRFVC
jgi:hypothetical protein